MYSWHENTTPFGVAKHPLAAYRTRPIPSPRHSTMSERDAVLSATLYVRDHTPASTYDRQRAVCERLRRLRERGVLDAVAVESWGNRVLAADNDDDDPPDIDDEARAVRDTYRAIEEWAAERGYTLAPAFETRTVGSLVSNERRDVTVLPAMCLVVFDDGSIRDVSPCSTGSGVRTVEDGLAALESGAVSNAVVM